MLQEVTDNQSARLNRPTQQLPLRHGQWAPISLDKIVDPRTLFSARILQCNPSTTPRGTAPSYFFVV